MQRTTLVEYLNELLQPQLYRDYTPNGLQVEGRDEVHALAVAVTASLEVVERAAEWGADALLVHHGYFWKGEPGVITGAKRARLRALLANDINLLAYHLPLDGHAELGNNVQLGRRLGWQIEGRFGDGPDGGIGFWGSLAQPVSPQMLATQLESELGRAPQWIDGQGGETIERLAWCSGAAQDWLEAAAALGVDAFVSGEISERTYHVAREAGVHYFAAGHHATERLGPLALGAQLQQRFDLEMTFIDQNNPI